MVKSILHFKEFGTKKLEKVIEKFMKEPTDIASFVHGVHDEMLTLGLDIIKESLEECNQMIREDWKRKEKWSIVRTDHKNLITSMGAVTFEKTLFKNKETGEECYLLDSILGLEKHARITEDAEAKLLEEAVQTSYRRGGEATGPTDTVSKQTVKNKIHRLEFPTPPIPAKKKVVDYLYIDADEDHVKLQFQEQKGDLKKDENNRKNNGILAKLVYVYEGIEPEAPKSKRHKLINPYYFSGVYEGDENTALWNEVYQYLDSHYDLKQVKKIYLGGDGAAWIKFGLKQIAGITYVLDEFHMSKYLNQMTTHMPLSASDAKAELRKAIKNGTKAEFASIVERIDSYAETPAQHKRVSDGANYIQSNWTSAKIRLSERSSICGCSAEGHVSHVLASRMSSRPMGWSRLGCDKMSHLRAYYYNGGDMLELVRFQEKELLKAAGAEDVILSCSEVLLSEKNKNGEVGKYLDAITHSLSLNTKKRAGFRSHIHGL